MNFSRSHMDKSDNSCFSSFVIHLFLRYEEVKYPCLGSESSDAESSNR